MQPGFNSGATPPVESTNYMQYTNGSVSGANGGVNGNESRQGRFGDRGNLGLGNANTGMENLLPAGFEVYHAMGSVAIPNQGNQLGHGDGLHTTGTGRAVLQNSLRPQLQGASIVRPGSGDNGVSRFALDGADFPALAQARSLGLETEAGAYGRQFDQRHSAYSATSDDYPTLNMVNVDEDAMRMSGRRDSPAQYLPSVQQYRPKRQVHLQQQQQQGLRQESTLQYRTQQGNAAPMPPESYGKYGAAGSSISNPAVNFLNDGAQAGLKPKPKLQVGNMGTTHDVGRESSNVRRHPNAYPNGFDSMGNPSRYAAKKRQDTSGISAGNQGFSSPGSVGRGDKKKRTPLNPAQKYGLLGLLSVIRSEDRDRAILDLGKDLTSLGLDLNSSDPLYATFSSPWSDAWVSMDQRIPVPAYYQIPSSSLGFSTDTDGGSESSSKLTKSSAFQSAAFSKFHIETLFFMFYSFPRDAAQIQAARELYKRDWRFHMDSQIWFLANAKRDEFNAEGQSIGYLYFDIKAWEQRPFKNLSKAESLSSGFMQASSIFPVAKQGDASTTVSSGTAKREQESRD